MRPANKRWQPRIGIVETGEGPYADYGIFRGLSVLDLMLLFRYNSFYKGTSIDTYVSELKKDGYFLDSTFNYRRGVKGWFNKYKA